MVSVVTEPTVEPALPVDWSLADLQHHLGGIPLERIRLYPAPGSATEGDVLRLGDTQDRPYELIDGTLVAKTMVWHESLLAILIVTELNNFVRREDLGIVLGADASLKILPQQVRLPNVCFISWSRFPKQKVPRRPIPALIPDLAIEVLSETNPKAEMDRKLREYFEAGVRLVWYIDPESRSTSVYTTVDQLTVIPENGVLDGADVLPGFELSLAELFAGAERQGPRE